MGYRPRQKARFASLEMAKPSRHARKVACAGGRPLLEGQKGDKAQQFLWARFPRCVCTSAARSEISDNVLWTSIARCVGASAGDLGRFELHDAIGVSLCRSCRKEGRRCHRSRKTFASGRKDFYDRRGHYDVFDMAGPSKKSKSPRASSFSITQGRRPRVNVIPASLMTSENGVCAASFTPR